MPFRLLKVKPFPKVDFRARISTQYSHSQIPFLPSVPSSIACCFYWKECRNSRGNIYLGVNTGHVIEITHFLYFSEYSSAWSWCSGGTRHPVCRECRQVFRPGWERCDWHDKEGNWISLSSSPAPSLLPPPPLACGLTFQPTESLRKRSCYPEVRRDLWAKPGFECSAEEIQDRSHLFYSEVGGILLLSSRLCI